MKILRWLPLVSFALGATILASAAAVSGDYNEALKLYQQKNYHAAAAKFEDALKANPRDANTIYYCALSQQLSNNHARARQLYEYITRAFPGTQVGNLAQSGLASLGGGTADGGIGAANGGESSTADAGSSTSAQPQAVLRDDFPDMPSEVRIPFARQNGGIYMEASVNGRPITVQLDSGAPTCLFGGNQMQELGLSRPARQVFEGQAGIGDNKSFKEWVQRVDMKLGPMYRRDFPVAVQEYFDGSPLLGKSFFGSLYVTVDEDNRQVIFPKRTATTIGNLRGDTLDVPFKMMQSGHYLVETEVNGKPCKMIFDTGADTVCFSWDDLKKLRIDVPDDAGFIRSKGTGGETEGRQFYLDKIKLGPITRENVQCVVVNGSNAPYPLLGQSFFSEYKFTIDNDNKVIKFRRQH